MFAAIYKILPDKPLGWRDVGVGAVATAFLFTVGKVLIGLYLGSSAVATSYGAAGTAILVLLWIYYSAVIFLLGAEFTKVYARQHGNKEAPPEPDAAQPGPAPVPATTRPRVPRRPFGALDAVAAGALILAVVREGRRRNQPRTWKGLLRGG